LEFCAGTNGMIDGFLISDLKSLLLKSLTKHTFVYLVEVIEEHELVFYKEELIQKESSEGIKYYRQVIADQTEGQLMGSVTSFPFLCIANAALCRLAMEKADSLSYKLTNNHRDKRPIAPLLINGDDCLFAGSKRLRPLWEKFTSVAGLESSVGKTYFSSNFCTINSVIFDRDWKTGIWEERKAINMGLLLGRSKNQSKRCKIDSKTHSKMEDLRERAPLQYLGAMSRDLKKLCPVDLWLKAKSRFLYYNRNQLKEHPNIPWFVPEWLGGMGFPLDHDSEICELDRRTCSFIKRNYHNRRYKPIVPMEMPFWLMHKRVMDKINSFGYSEVNYRNVLNPVDGSISKLEKEFSSLYKQLVVELMFTMSLKDITQLMNKESSIKKSYFHNVKVWEFARKIVAKSFHLFEPMSNEDMELENKKLTIACKAHTSLPEIDGCTFATDYLHLKEVVECTWENF